MTESSKGVWCKSKGSSATGKQKEATAKTAQQQYVIV